MLRLIPTWAWGAAAALALAGAFGAGFEVASWRCESEKLEAVQRAIKRAEEARDRVHKESTNYEQSRQQGRVEAAGREQAVREIYRTVEVPSECAAPDSVRSLLDGAVRAANGNTQREPGG